MGRRPSKISPDLVVGMKAAGVPLNKIAEALDASTGIITGVLNREPGSREHIAELREKLKGIKMVHAHAVEGRIWERLKKEVGAPAPDDPGKWIGGEARDVDAISRSLLAMEKIQAGVSGEGAASGAPPAPTSADLSNLIQILVNAP